MSYLLIYTNDYVHLITQVTQAPRVEAMRMRLAAQNSSKESWLEWIGSKDGLLNKEPLLQQQQQQQQLQVGGSDTSSQGLHTKDSDQPPQVGVCCFDESSD